MQGNRNGLGVQVAPVWNRDGHEPTAGSEAIARSTGGIAAAVSPLAGRRGYEPAGISLAGIAGPLRPLGDKAT